MEPVATRITTAAIFASSNPVLAKGEVGRESDTGIVKTGDGVTAWSKLPQVGNNVPDTNPVRINETLTGLFYESFNEGLTAFAGGGQGSATPITNEIARVTTVATSGDSVKLPTATSGLTIMVINHGANPMQVFGSGTDTIDDTAAATGVSQMQNSMVIYTCTVPGKWYANGLGTGFASSLPTVSSTDQITASATQTQAAATQLTTVLNRVVTVAAAGNAVKLPASAVGLQVTVVNAHATNAVGVFPNTGDAINALGANAVYSLAATKTATFYCAVAGQWHTILSA